MNDELRHQLLDCLPPPTDPDSSELESIVHAGGRRRARGLAGGAVVVALLAGGAGVTAFAVHDHRGTSTLMGAEPSTATPATPQPAALGDGVCAESMKAYGVTLTAIGDLPEVHTKDQAIALVMKDGVPLGTGVTIDGYRARLTYRAGPTPSVNRPVWVIVFTGINYPLGGAAHIPGTAQASPHPPTFLHHEITYLDDATGTEISAQTCP